MRRKERLWKWGEPLFLQRSGSYRAHGNRTKTGSSSVGFGTGPNRDRLGLVCPHIGAPGPKKLARQMNCYLPRFNCPIWSEQARTSLAFAKATANPPLKPEQGAGTIYPNTYRLDVTGVPGNFEIIRRLYA